MRTITAVLPVALLIGGCGSSESPERRAALKEETVSFDRDSAELVNVEIRLAAGELRVSGGSPKLAEGRFRYDDASAKPKVRYHTSAFRGRLVIDQERSQGGGESQWELKLSNDVPLHLQIHSGATEAKLNLGSLDLRGIECNVGVGSIELDLRGTPKRSYDVRLKGGVGEATVRLPSGVNITADAKGGIGDVEVSGLQKDGGRWVRRVDRIGAPTVQVDVHGGVGSIKLIAE